MTQRDLIARVRAWRGPIYATVNGRHDPFYFKIVKSDALEVLARVGDGQLEVREVNGSLYVDNAL